MSTRLRALAHRIRHGHWRQPWEIYLLTDQPARGCRRCVLDAVLRDVRDSERPPTGKAW